MSEVCPFRWFTEEQNPYTPEGGTKIFSSSHHPYHLCIKQDGHAHKPHPATDHKCSCGEIIYGLDDE